MQKRWLYSIVSFLRCFAVAQNICYQNDWRSGSRKPNTIRSNKKYSNASEIHSKISLNHPMSEWNECICLKRCDGFCNDSTWLLRSIRFCSTCSLSVRWFFLFDSLRTVLLLSIFSLVCFEHSICYYGNNHQYNAILFVCLSVHLFILMLMRRSVHDSFICLIALHFIWKVFRPKNVHEKHWTTKEGKKDCGFFCN